MQEKIKMALRLPGFALLAMTAPALLAQQAPETTGTPLKRPAPIQAPAASPALTASRPAAPEGADEKTLTVSRFEFKGNSVFSTDLLAGLVKGYTATPVTLAQVYEAADKIADYYVREGYNLASVTLPPQKITDGVVQLEIIEGRIAAVNVEGNSRYNEEQITRNLGALVPGQVYRGAEVESGLYRVNALPGLSARAVLRPGENYGTSNLLIKVTEKVWTASLAGDNYGRENLGEYRGSLSASVNNPFRFEDQLQGIVLNTDGGRLQYYYLGYNVPVASTGVRLGLSYGEGRFVVDSGIPGVDVEGKNKTSRLSLDYLFADSRVDTLGVGLAAVNTKANADLTGESINDTDITLFELSGFHNHSFSNLAATQVSLVLASDLGQGEDTGVPSESTKQPMRAELDAQLLYPIVGQLSAYLRGNAVHSSSYLPQVTQASLGGPSSVRAYPAAEVRGDRSFFGSIGLRQGLQAGRADWGLRAFADSGHVTDLADGVSPERSETLSSVGVGVDFGMPLGTVRISAKADWSFALDDHSDGYLPDGTGTASSPDDQRLYATVSVSY